MGKNNKEGIDAFTVNDIIAGVQAIEALADSIMVGGATVICTACAESSSQSKMKKDSGSLSMQKKVELGHKDIEFTPLFKKCLVGDHVCKPEIEGDEWQDYDTTKVTSTGDFSLLKDKSYMLCTKGFGIIYATDNGQRIDSRQSASLKLLMQRWIDNPDEMGFLKGMLNVCAYSKDPVNLNTGNFIYEHIDLSMTGAIPFGFKRFYNAMDIRKGSLGAGWVHNFEMHLKIKRNKLILFHEDGREQQFQKLSEVEYRDKQTGLEVINVEKQGDVQSYVYITNSHNRHQFDQDGNERFREDLNGSRIFFSYNADNQLIQAECGGLKLFYEYAATGLLAKVWDHTGRMVDFEYDDGLLVAVTGMNGNRIGYEYGSNGKIKAIINARGIQTIHNEYDNQFRTIKQIFPDKGEVCYTYHDKDRMVEMTEQNGNQVKHYYDEMFRNIKTEYETGREEFTYNVQNRLVKYKDKRGYLTKYAYDNKGNETQVVDALGNRTNKTYNEKNKLVAVSVNGNLKIKNQYDKRGNLTKSVDALNRSIGFTYNQKNKPNRYIQMDGSEYSFEYDERGNLTKLTDPEYYEISYQYDSLNRVVSTTDANNNRFQYAYDAHHNLVKVINPGGQVQSYTYNESDKVTSFMDFNGEVCCWEYDVLNKPSKIIDMMGNETTLQYDKMWNLCTVTDPNGNQVKYQYNHANLLESVTNSVGGTITYQYDENGNQTAIIGVKGEVTEFCYDPLNRVTEIIEPNGAIHHYEYNDQGQICVYTDPMRQTVSYEYNAVDQKIREINALGEVTCYTYDKLSNLTAIIKEDCTLVKLEYDSRSLLVRESRVSGEQFCYEYDGNHNLIKRTDQNDCVWDYCYDSFSRVVEIRKNQSSHCCYHYDAVGNLTEMTDANGNTSRYLYDPCGNLIGVTDPLGNQTAYGYDKSGQLTHVVQSDVGMFQVDAEPFSINEILKINDKKRLRITAYKRNENGQVSQMTDPMGNIERFCYDKAGNLLSKTDKDGYVTSYSYNEGNDISKITYGDGKQVRFQYDPLRQLTQFEDWLGITRIENDVLGRPVKVIDHKEREISYSWGTWNERTQIRYPNGKMITYQYDEHLRLAEITGLDTKVNYTYDESGYLSKKDFNNGVKTTYSYDQLGQLKTLTHWNRKEKLDEYQYCYDPMGNKTGVQKNRNGLKQESGAYGYHYDALNRLQQVIKDGSLIRTYQYDAFGNRIQMDDGKRCSSYTYNALNQMIHKVDSRYDMGKSKALLSEENYDYDGRGNLTKIYRNGTMVNEYCFGDLNRLEKTVNHKTGQQAVYGYNGLGHRVSKTELDPMNKIEDVLDITRQYHNLLMRYENIETYSYLWDSNVISASGPEEKPRMYLQDELGSPIRLMTEGSYKQETYGYDEFGNDLYYQRPKHQPFGYTGYQRDPVADTNYAQAREYRAEVGRFISEDVVKGNIKYPLTFNLYNYCRQNPLKWLDLNGKSPMQDDLLKDLADAVNGYKDWKQDAATKLHNSNEEALNIVLKYDETIILAAQKYGVDKEAIQSVLFQELRFYNTLDPIADSLVNQTYYYHQAMEDYMNAPWYVQLFRGAPDPVLGARTDSSTGAGQIFAKTAIEAYNAKHGTNYDVGNWKDLKFFWDNLQDDKYNIDMIGMVLWHKSTLLEKKLGRTPSIEEVMKAYNGTGDLAERYKEVVSKYYEAFNQYNKTCAIQ